jgi:hypothetical protein
VIDRKGTRHARRVVEAPGIRHQDCPSSGAANPRSSMAQRTTRYEHLAGCLAAPCRGDRDVAGGSAAERGGRARLGRK